MEIQASCCTSLSFSEAEACKLPLLDGETSGPIEIITTEIRLKNAVEILDLYRRDRILFSGTACTAWALLLRCYTGQERVTFAYTTDNANATVSLLQMSFGEDEVLSNYTKRARDAITGIEQKRLAPSKQSTATINYKTVSSLVNTAVCICDSGMPTGMLGTKTAGVSTEVSS